MMHSCYPITDVGLASLASLKNLTSLDLTCCRVTDDWLAFLAIFLKNLTDLNLSGCNQISEGGLASLASGSNLTSLSLGQCGITDGALACLIPLSQLATLSLAGNELITNLAPLANLTHLTTLHLDWCKGIDAAELQSLRERLPNLRITQFLYLSQ
jgi:Leucine-rich repeat (LRR) protein